VFQDLSEIGVEQRLAGEVGTEHLGHRLDLGYGVLERLVAVVPIDADAHEESAPFHHSSARPSPGTADRRQPLDRRFDVVPGHVTYRSAYRG